MDSFFYNINVFVCLTQNRFSFSSRVRLVRFQQPCRFSSPPRTHRLHLVGSPRVNRACPPGEEANPIAEDPSEDYNGFSTHHNHHKSVGHAILPVGPCTRVVLSSFRTPRRRTGIPSCRYVEIATQVAITWRVEGDLRGVAGRRRKREPAQAATKRQRDKKRATQDRR